MSVEDMYIIWAAAIVVFAVLEAVTVQLVSIWFVIGSVAAFVSSLFGAPLYLQVVIWLIVSVVALIFTRPLVKKKLNAKAQPTNADRCIGKDAVVIEEINNKASTGQVKTDGKVWTARSDNNEIIRVGDTVIVQKIDGVKLIVSKK